MNAQKGQSSLSFLRCILALLTSALFHFQLSANASDEAAFSLEDIEFFEKQIRPLLSEACYDCHSRRAKKLKGGLQLDSRANVLRGGDSGAAAISGNPSQSLLIEAITYENVDLQMPPKTKLSKMQIDALRTWIDRGLPWTDEDAIKSITKSNEGEFDLAQRQSSHWSWQSIKIVSPPKVQNASWVRNPVDAFILHRLEEKGLSPALPSSPRHLIRRLNYTLLGLPPSPKSVDAFARARDPLAYHRLLDRLLASPQFGERWARHWLDLVRYSETMGHEFDYEIPNAWHYRDYLIRAFNEDLPYDQFVREHIAGDLLKPRLAFDGSNESPIATGFYWLGQQVHSPVDIEMNQLDVIDNQIDVLSKTFLAMTISCARCHDHKFDAISTRDFYSLFGTLASSRYHEASIGSPSIFQQKRLELKSKKRTLQSLVFREWRDGTSRLKDFALAANRLVNESDESFPNEESIDAMAKHEKLNLQTLHRWVEEWTAATNRVHPLFELRNSNVDLAFENASQKTNNPESQTLMACTKKGGFEDWFFNGEAMKDAFLPAGEILVDEDSITIHAEPLIHSARFTPRFQGSLRSPTFEISKRYLHVLAAGKDCRINVVIDNFNLIRAPIYGGLKKPLNHKKKRWIAFDLEMWKGHEAYLEIKDSVVGDLAGKAAYDESAWFSVSKVLSSSTLPHADPPFVLPFSLTGKTLDERLTITQKETLNSLKKWASPTNEEDEESLERMSPSEWNWLAWLAEKALLNGESSASFVKSKTDYLNATKRVQSPFLVPSMTEGSGRDHAIFIRGNPRMRGEVAERGFLEVWQNGETENQFDESNESRKGSGRLDFANEITNGKNPLIARVYVNRIWHHFFGRGIVESTDNFGVLGTMPTHPELLDWLAHWFMNEGQWSTKKLIRLLATSATFQMASAPDPMAQKADPSNRLFYHMPIRRLEGEAIRDAILQVSGDLRFEIFGKPVPIYLTQFMTGRGRPRQSGPLDGAHRRTIYQAVRRNFLSPMMLAFDTPIPHTTFGKRSVSNVPAQALILMNDPFVLHQARRWAENLLQKYPNAKAETLIDLIYVTALSRHPSRFEQSEALAFIASQHEKYHNVKHEKERVQMLWADFCHVVFNLKEFLFLQ